MRILKVTSFIVLLMVGLLGVEMRISYLTLMAILLGGSHMLNLIYLLRGILIIVSIQVKIVIVMI